MTSLLRVRSVSSPSREGEFPLSLNLVRLLIYSMNSFTLAMSYYVTKDAVIQTNTPQQKKQTRMAVLVAHRTVERVRAERPRFRHDVVPNVQRLALRLLIHGMRSDLVMRRD